MSESKRSRVMTSTKLTSLLLMIAHLVIRLEVYGCLKISYFVALVWPFLVQIFKRMVLPGK